MKDVKRRIKGRKGDIGISYILRRRLDRKAQQEEGNYKSKKKIG